MRAWFLFPCYSLLVTVCDRESLKCAHRSTCRMLWATSTILEFLCCLYCMSSMFLGWKIHIQNLTIDFFKKIKLNSDIL